MLVALPLVVAVIGLIMYFIASNPKVQEIGRIMFWTGVLAFWLGGGVGAVYHSTH
jgi:cytochrome c oxidase assembly factor CtaG